MDEIKVRSLNDRFREKLKPKDVELSQRVQALAPELQNFAIYKVQTWDDWTDATNRLRQTGIFAIEDDTYVWAIYYQDKRDTSRPSPTPEDPEITRRIVKIFHHSEI